MTILLEVKANHVKKPSSAFTFSGYFQDERDYKAFPHDITAAILVSQTVLWELNLFLTLTLCSVVINLDICRSRERKRSIGAWLSFDHIPGTGGGGGGGGG